MESGLRPEECAYGCVGAGSCVEACTFGALSVEDGNVTVDRDKCNGCGACVSACVQHLFRMVPAKATNFVPCANQDEEDRAIRLCGYSRIGRGDCVEACPEGPSPWWITAPSSTTKSAWARVASHRLLPEEDHRGHTTT